VHSLPRLLEFLLLSVGHVLSDSGPGSKVVVCVHVRGIKMCYGKGILRG
jgi:hypothetical protein